MTPLIISIENAIRLLQGKAVRDVFLNLEIGLKDTSADYRFEVYQHRGSAQALILQKSVRFSTSGAIFLDSHEDPIISHSDYTYLSMAIEKKLLLPGDLWVRVYQNEKLFFSHHVTQIHYQSLFKELNTELVDTYTLKTHRSCTLTLHLNDSLACYTEETFHLNAGETFNFFSYLSYSYIGVQFSFEDMTPEVEEKYIIKGQKGIYESAWFMSEDQILQSNMPFRLEYAGEKTQGFTEIKNIDQLLEYHRTHRVRYFEMSHEFLIEHYRANLTYSQSKLYTKSRTGKIGKIHTDSEVCSGCDRKSICLQTVPSGLSYALFKENIALSEPQECRVYQIISNN